MCNLYSIRASRAALARKFRLSDSRMAAVEPLDAIFPATWRPSSSKAPTASASW